MPRAEDFSFRGIHAGCAYVSHVAGASTVEGGGQVGWPPRVCLCDGIGKAKLRSIRDRRETGQRVLGKLLQERAVCDGTTDSYQRTSYVLGFDPKQAFPIHRKVPATRARRTATRV